MTIATTCQESNSDDDVELVEDDLEGEFQVNFFMHLKRSRSKKLI